MTNEDTEQQVAELRRISRTMCQHLDEGEAILHDVDTCLAALATLRPDWDVTLVADILLLHERERQSQEPRLMSVAVRLPGGVAIGLLHGDVSDAVVNGDQRNALEGIRFLPFLDAPPLIRRATLPLIPYALDALCDRLASQH